MLKIIYFRVYWSWKIAFWLIMRPIKNSYKQSQLTWHQKCHVFAYIAHSSVTFNRNQLKTQLILSSSGQFMFFIGVPVNEKIMETCYRKLHIFVHQSSGIIENVSDNSSLKNVNVTLPFLDICHNEVHELRIYSWINFQFHLLTITLTYRLIKFRFSLIRKHVFSTIFQLTTFTDSNFMKVVCAGEKWTRKW